jgi:hypothetical protein
MRYHEALCPPFFRLLMSSDWGCPFEALMVLRVLDALLDMSLDPSVKGTFLWNPCSTKGPRCVTYFIN